MLTLSRPLPIIRGRNIHDDTLALIDHRWCVTHDAPMRYHVYGENWCGYYIPELGVSEDYGCTLEVACADRVGTSFYEHEDELDSRITAAITAALAHGGTA